MSLFRWRDGRWALLMADEHEATATPVEFFEQRSGAFSKCRACFRIGLHMDIDSKRIHCHRCRAASLERFYDQLLDIDGFITDIKRIILWNIFRHPVVVFKNEVRALRVHHMTDLLRGPLSFSSHDGSSQRNNILWIINEHMHYDRRWGVNLRGKRYRVGKGNLLTGNHLFPLIIDFLF
jgi:hypothetical protein